MKKAGRISISEKEKESLSERMRGNTIWRGRTHTEETRRKLQEIALKDGRKPPSNLGKKLSPKHCENIRKSKLGNKNPGFGKKRSIETRTRMALAQQGAKAWNWQGGRVLERLTIRHSLKYKLWREGVFERDNYTCQKYWIRGGFLQPHHIQNFAQYPELRFAIDNGITLSKRAHEEFHKKYGKNNNTREQLIEFLQS